MKRFLAGILVLLLLFGSAFADDDIYIVECKVESVGCTILCPSNLTVLYKGMPTEQLNMIGLSKEQVDDLMDTFDLEFLAYNDGDTYELQVYRSETSVDFSLWNKSDAYIQVFLLSTFVPSIEKKLGTTITSPELVRTDENAYIRYEWADEEESENAIAYFTIVDGSMYDFYFFCRETVEDYEDEMAKAIIDCIEWDFNREAQKEPSTSVPSEIVKTGYDLALHYSEQKQISIALPSNYDVITQETTESRLFDEDQVALIQENMKNAGNIFDAVSQDYSREITVNVADSIIPSFGLLTDEDFNIFYSNIMNKYSGLGTIISHESVKDGNVRYIKVKVLIGSGDNAYYALQYGTVVDSQSIWVSLLIYDELVLEEDQLLIEQIWKNSILAKHDNNPVSVNTEKGEANRYTDPDSGFSIVIPDGWVQVPLLKERQFIKMKMSPEGKESSASILYGQADVYGMLSDEEKKEWGIRERSDVDSILDEGFAEAFLDDDTMSLEKSEIKGTEYYMGSASHTGSVSKDTEMGEIGMQYETEMTCAVFLKNGYFVMLQFLDMTNYQEYQKAYDMVLNSLSFLNE